MSFSGNIYLIGFMASGKTAVGRILAKKLGKKYVSTDTLIEKKAKKKIRTIFREKGEGLFRKLETGILISVSKKKGLVISCGGGIVLKPENRRVLKRTGTCVWLKASPLTVNARLGSLKTRPLLNIPDKIKRLAKIKQLMSARSRHYKAASNLEVDTDRLNVQKTASMIISGLS